MPPSVLIADLLDYLVMAIAADANDPAQLATARRRLLVEHPLQPFAARYFTIGGDRRVTSSNSEYCDALNNAAAETIVNRAMSVEADAVDSDDDGDSDDDDKLIAQRQRFFSTPLPRPEPQWQSVSLTQLQRFFANPCRYLLQQRLGLRMLGKTSVLQDDEPFIAEWSGMRALEKRLYPLFLDGVNYADIAAMAAAGNELPGGVPGQQIRHTVLQQLQQFVSALAQATMTPCLPPQEYVLPFDLDGERWTLTSNFSDLRSEGLIRSRYDQARPADYLCGWIDHLAMNAALPDGVVGDTLWLSRDGSYRLRPTESAREILGELMRLYRQGLSTPLHFFPKSAWAYQRKGGDLAAARKTWLHTARTPHAEQTDPAYELALRGTGDALNADFEHAARTVFAPLLHYLEESR